MNYYHHIRELKQQRADQIANMPLDQISSVKQLPYSISSVPNKPAHQSVSLLPPFSAPTSSPNVSSTVSPSPSKPVARTSPRSARASSASNVSLSQMHATMTPVSAAVQQLPTIPASAGPSSPSSSSSPPPSTSSASHSESDLEVVQYHLFELTGPQLAALGITRRQVSSANVQRLLRHHCLVGLAADQSLDARLAVLAKFLRVQRAAKQ